MPVRKTAAKTGKSPKSAARKAAPARKPAARKTSAKPRTRGTAKVAAKAKAKPSRRPAAPKAAARPKSKAARKAVRKAAPSGKTVAKRKTAATKSSVKAAAKPKPARAAPRKVAAKAPAKRPAPRRPAATAQPPRAIAVPSRNRAAEPPPSDDDDYEPESRHSLLLGPRNVKPYIQRRGEIYMSKEQLNHFGTILSAWKRDLMEEVDRTMNHMKDEAATPPDPNDRATLESEFALELRTRDRERKLIRKIDEALKRIEDGSYGYCLETGEPIGVKRLEARPVATLCIEAQERRERREKQYGDRDDWYR